MVRVRSEVAGFLRQKLNGRKARELADEADLPEKTIHRLLNARNMPTLQTMWLLCAAYNCDIHEIAPSFPHRANGDDRKPRA